MSRIENILLIMLYYTNKIVTRRLHVSIYFIDKYGDSQLPL